MPKVRLGCEYVCILEIFDSAHHTHTYTHQHIHTHTSHIWSNTDTTNAHNLLYRKLTGVSGPPNSLSRYRWSATLPYVRRWPPPDEVVLCSLMTRSVWRLAASRLPQTHPRAHTRTHAHIRTPYNTNTFAHNLLFLETRN